MSIERKRSTDVSMATRKQETTCVSTNLGFVNEFDESNESWTDYTERLEEYFIANNIDDNKKKMQYSTRL